MQHARQQTPYFTQEPNPPGGIDLLQAIRNQNAKRKTDKSVGKTPIQLSDSVLKHLKNPTGQTDNSSIASFGEDPRFMLKSELDVSSTSEDALSLSEENLNKETLKTDKIP